MRERGSTPLTPGFVRLLRPSLAGSITINRRIQLPRFKGLESHSLGLDIEAFQLTDIYISPVSRVNALALGSRGAFFLGVVRTSLASYQLVSPATDSLPLTPSQVAGCRVYHLDLVSGKLFSWSFIASKLITADLLRRICSRTFSVRLRLFPSVLRPSITFFPTILSFSVPFRPIRVRVMFPLFPSHPFQPSTLGSDPSSVSSDLAL